LEAPAKRKGVIFCSYQGKWKDELEERLETDEKVTLRLSVEAGMKSLHICRNKKT